MAKVVIADYPALSVDYSWGGLSTMVVITIAMLKPELKSLLANCFLSSPPAFQPLMQILIHCPVNLLIANPIFFFTLSTTFFLRLSGLPAHSAWCSSQSWYYMFNIKYMLLAQCHLVLMCFIIFPKLKNICSKSEISFCFHLVLAQLATIPSQAASCTMFIHHHRHHLNWFCVCSALIFIGMVGLQQFWKYQKNAQIDIFEFFFWFLSWFFVFGKYPSKSQWPASRTASRPLHWLAWHNESAPLLPVSPDTQ